MVLSCRNTLDYALAVFVSPTLSLSLQATGTLDVQLSRQRIANNVHGSSTATCGLCKLSLRGRLHPEVGLRHVMQHGRKICLCRHTGHNSDDACIQEDFKSSIVWSFSICVSCAKPPFMFVFASFHGRGAFHSNFLCGIRST